MRITAPLPEQLGRGVNETGFQDSSAAAIAALIRYRELRVIVRGEVVRERY